MKARIYHNPRCSKSRATLALLEARGVEVEVVHYLVTPPTANELRDLLGQLGLEARNIVRPGEPEFEASGLHLDAPEDELLGLIERHPKILERPIVTAGGRARIGRPPENVLDLLQ